MAAIIAFKDYLFNPYEVTDPIVDSPQFREGKFLNPGENIDLAFGSMLGTMWEFATRDNDRKPKVELPRQPVDLAAHEIRDQDQLVVSWLGHSSLLINIDGVLLLTDPVLEKRISLFGPTRFNGEPPVAVEELPPIDLVLISHDHYDHLNKFTIKSIHGKVGQFVAPLGVGQLLAKWGVPEEKIVELDWWETAEIEGLPTIVSTPAQHFSGRGLFDRNKSLWTSYVVLSENHKIFFGGDSGYFGGFKRIGDKYGPFDMTFLECGAYNDKWAAIHMRPEETAQAHLDLRGRVLHPIHWGTFNLSLHPWYEPMRRLTRAAKSHEIALATPVVGGTTIYAESVPDSQWWEIALKGAATASEQTSDKQAIADQ